MSWSDDTNTLTLTATLVKDDPYKLTFYIPEGYALRCVSRGDAAVADKLLTVTRAPSRTGEYAFTVSLDNRK